LTRVNARRAPAAHADNRPQREPAMGVRNDRRRFAGRALALLAAIAVAPGRGARAAASYPATIAAVKEARAVETRVSQQYFAFGRKAREDGYKGVAYLFAAFASSEHIHAANFGKVLAQLGADAPPLPPWSGPVGTTRENLIAAAKGEAESIEDLYPKMLDRISREGHQEAMRFVKFAWASERQHHDRIRQVRRYSPTMFELVAKHIDAKTSAYFVCHACGSTLNAVPAQSCPVCQVASTSYRRIEPPA
jgi:rubrerythrin